MCDPRIAKHNHLLRSVSFLLKHPEETALRSLPRRDTYQPLAPLIPKLGKVGGSEGGFKNPNHLRIYVDSELVEAVAASLSELGKGGDVLTSPAMWTSYWEKATSLAEAAKPLCHREAEHDTSGRISDSVSALRALLETKIVVGFHPDQATEACIDLALILRVPFAVVPCCVFPSEFISRRTEDGERVRTYDELISYLHRKVPFARLEMLNFHRTVNARSIVLFTMAEDVAMYPCAAHRD
mmetsp:Transcript_4527/g.12620  ORF Transcript_4527/g.12620 Transcript_4527/m.12620 type:complete len:240 (+) Transcript_4527:660-1379(+)